MAYEKRLIDANLLVGTCEEIAKHEWNKKSAPVSWSDAYEGFIDTIEEMPTVDAVEVCRCMNCKHWTDDECVSGSGYCQHGHWAIPDTCLPLMLANDFCSYGERKDND